MLRFLCYESYSTVLRAVVSTRYRRVTDRRTDRGTDGIAVASTELAMRALRRAVKIGSVCPSVCATFSASINPLPSDRLRCCDRYIRCQRSLAVKPLNSWPAISGSPSRRGSVRRVSRYQFTHVRYRTAAAGRARWQLASWCMRGANWLSETSLTAAAGGVGLWTLTRMCSITQTDAIALSTSTLQLIGLLLTSVYVTYVATCTYFDCAHHFGQLSCRATIALCAMVALLCKLNSWLELSYKSSRLCNRCRSAVTVVHKTTQKPT